MADQWAWYKLALAGKAPPMHDGRVESGFYWTKASKNGGRLPIGIWRPADNEFVCRVGTIATARVMSENEVAQKWPFICSNPVSRDDYLVAFKTGAWPDGTPAVAPTTSNSNLPTDPFERLQAEVADKMASAEAWLKSHAVAKTKTDADMARNLQAELLALNKQADAMHKAEKAPILAAGEAIETKFSFRKAVKSVGERLRDVFSAFAVAEEARQKAEAQKRFEAERRAAEAARREAEAARAKKMDDDPIAALTDPEPELPMVPVAPEAVKVQVGGGIGRAAGLKSIWHGDVTDWDACIKHFAEAPDVREAVQKLVNAQVRSTKGATKIPGVTIREERKAA